MEKYQLTLYPNKILMKKSLKVEKIAKKEINLIDNMLNIMLEQQGIGLAAPQVGAASRIITYLKSLQDLNYHEDQNNFNLDENKSSSVENNLDDENGLDKVSDNNQLDLPSATKQDIHVLINPKIISKSSEQISYEEGCLSLPGVRAMVTRPRYIKLSYVDIKGDELEKEAKDLEAICIQHEIDHLDGILFIDHLSRLKKKSVVKKYLKQLTQEK